MTLRWEITPTENLMIMLRNLKLLTLIFISEINITIRLFLAKNPLKFNVFFLHKITVKVVHFQY